jgi:DNA mismatch repair protein MutL
MGIVRLDQAVADAIAAGEVVERPASVVKELVENSIDAGAGHVTIEVEGAGMDRILVLDDGAGMPPGDLPLAFMRHATSKLSSIAQLGRIESLGFRGEALASIAAVSRVEARSALPGAAEGGLITVEHGLVAELRPATPITGTRIEVRGLFENTPARRAFIKRPATEVAAVTRVVVALALCHPGVAFRLTVDGRHAVETGGNGDRAAVMRSVTRGGMEALLVSGGSGEATIDGVISEPEGLRRSREHLYLSVNGRPISSRSLAFAVEQAYRGLVAPGLFPVGTLALHLPLDTVDVNVHPTKREVRFRAERAVFTLVQASCVEALSRSAVYTGSGLLSTPEATPTGAEYPAGSPAGVALAEAPGLTASGTAYDVGAADGATLLVEELQLAGMGSTQAAAMPILRGPFRLVGQVMDCYIVAEGPNGLVLVDQHAAHERVLFNQLLATRGATARQPMLVPALLQLTPVQAACLEDCRADLAAAGLEIEDFGATAARLTAHDAALSSHNIDRIAVDVLDSLIAEGKDLDHSRRLERATYTVACHSAIKFGQRLSREEMEGLLRALETADPGITCPHGRPTMLEITDGQLRREFQRS